MGAVQRLATVVIIGLVALSTVLVLYTADENNRVDKQAELQQEAAVTRATSTYIQYCLACHGPAGEGLMEQVDPKRLGLPLGGDTYATALNQQAIEADGTPYPGGMTARAEYLTKTIHNGKGTIMPAWGQENGGELNDQQIVELVLMIQHVDWNKVYNASIEASGGYPTVPPSPAATETAAAGTGTEAASTGGGSAGAAGGETNLTLNAVDIAWEPTELTGPADQEFTITITNKGAAQHDFSIPDLNITTELINPGQSVSVKVKAPAGTYQYICTVPGHKEAGMVGTLTLVAGGGAAAGAETPAAGGEAAGAAASGETNLTLDAIDIAWEPKELTGPADQEFTITITNKGAAQHDFSIPDLNITTELLNPGQTVSVKVKAPAGAYQYICTVPGHKEAGMVGTLTLVAGGGAATSGGATAASEATAATESGAASTGGETNLELNAVDIAWEPTELTGPADQDFTITITNKGAAQHDFSIPDLNITTELLNPGQSVTVTVKAPAGTYQYICTVPGHKEAGMVGTLTLK